jgi:hypothetical protein
MAFKDDLKLHFDARIAVVNVVTSEEARVLQELTELVNAGPEGEGLYTWDVADQFQCLKPAKDSFDTKREATPDTILRAIEDFAGGATFVLKDFHQVWEARRGVLRGIRNLAARLPESAPRKNIVIITPEHCLPAELKHDVPVLELAKPDAREMDALIERTVGGAGALRGVNPALRALVEAASDSPAQAAGVSKSSRGRRGGARRGHRPHHRGSAIIRRRPLSARRAPTAWRPGCAQGMARTAPARFRRRGARVRPGRAARSGADRHPGHG